MSLSFCKSAGLSLTVILGLMGAQSALAEEMMTLPFRDVMVMPEAQNSLSNSITLYFGDQLHPPVTHDEGGFYFTERRNRVFKDNKTVCRTTALAALLDLQKRANALGSNAITDITSYYNKKTISGENYQCYVGPFTTSVTLKGNMGIIN